MKHIYRQIDQRVKVTPRQIDQRVQVVREQAMIRYVYGKRG